MTEAIDKKDAEAEEERNKIIEENKKGDFFKRLLPYNHPQWLIPVGFMFSAIAGSFFPVFGIGQANAMFSMMIPLK